MAGLEDHMSEAAREIYQKLQAEDANRRRCSEPIDPEQIVRDAMKAQEEAGDSIVDRRDPRDPTLKNR